MVSPNETTLREDKSFQLHIGRKKTANSENIFKTDHGTMGDPSTFHDIRKSTHGSS